jgi:hypothetical protein
MYKCADHNGNIHAGSSLRDAMQKAAAADREQK